MFGFNKSRVEQFRRQFGKNPMDQPGAYMTIERLPHIRMYHDVCDEAPIDDITWSDLEMDDVFFRVNQTKSFVGEQVLYRKLHGAKAEDDREGSQGWMEPLIDFFGGNEEVRLDFEQKLAGIGKVQTSYWFPRMLRLVNGFEAGKVWVYRLLQINLAVFLVLALVFRLPIFGTLAVIAAGINLILYMTKQKEFDKMITCMINICTIMTVGEKLVKKWPLEGAQPVRERELLKKYHRFRRTAGSFAMKSASSASDPFNLLADYLFGITLFDLVSFAKTLKKIHENVDEIDEVYQFVGSVDMAISIASYRKSLPLWCRPNLEETEEMKCRQIYHPLIEGAVRNDVDLKRNIMITGANASGKSTFMKAVAINIVLGQAIYTCSAKEFSFAPMAVMSSMAIRDDVMDGESYYVREVRYMGRMLERIEDGQPVLLVIDEILKGTNQIERLAASEAILRYLAGRECRVMVATHDYDLVEKLDGEYECFYFQSHYASHEISFDYLIRRGFGGETNAVSFLEYFEFPEEILQEIDRILKS